MAGEVLPKNQSAFKYLKSHRVGPVGWIEYNNPPRNTFNWDMNREVIAALEAQVGDPAVRVIVFASALEQHFSVGADIKLFDGISQQEMTRVITDVHALTRDLRASPKPLLAAIHGTAVGGGLEITLHCDVRFATEDARLGQPEINFNFMPPIGATQALARLLGRTRAIRYLYDGHLVSAQEALAMGLVDQLTPPRTLRQVVQTYAEELAAKPPEALAAIRRCITQGGAMSFEEGLSLEFDALRELSNTENFAEGVRAFLQKRPPEWK